MSVNEKIKEAEVVEAEAKEESEQEEEPKEKKIVKAKNAVTGFVKKHAKTAIVGAAGLAVGVVTGTLIKSKHDDSEEYDTDQNIVDVEYTAIPESVEAE